MFLLRDVIATVKFISMHDSAKYYWKTIILFLLVIIDGILL